MNFVGYDVGVIGGGVIGLACAWRLAQAGCRVGLWERGAVGSEASWAAAGMLAAQCEAAHYAPEAQTPSRAAMFDLCLQSRALYPAFTAELQDATGHNVELFLRDTANPDDWRTPGICYVVTQDDDPAPHAFIRQQQQGLAVEVAPDYVGRTSFWLPDEGQVDNRKLVVALSVACKRSGVAIHEHAPLQNWQELQKNCDKVLLCGGAWSDLAQWGVELIPIAGEMLALQAGHLVPKQIYSSRVYLVPRRSGRLIVGATMEQRGFDKNVKAGAVQELLSLALSLAPQLRDCALLETWAGVRPGTPDGLPMLGRTPEPDVLVATGHFRNGILLAPITAQLICNHILHDHEIPGAFALQRFSLNS
jgi:glycine oxidase